ncbi:glycosyltransferase [Altibacter sp. HG106]|uniref:glycosyltransferase n=1 Tax=Altibacter sp. HG106 TaxID=3023937 RepID=UPI0023509B35|nr:glycosyltransferase [Altibacter sp. HG106]MDC7995712.1 glycosyltransferase [Altibacter sp. HG106]
MLKVLHITTSPKGGAGIAAFRLHNALRRCGVASAFLTKKKSIDYDGSLQQDPFFEYQAASLFQRLSNRLFPSEYKKQQLALQQKVTDQRCEGPSLALAPYATETHPWVQEADIIHLHWVGGIINFPTFFKTIDCPVVWTLHDMNPFMGVFHYEGDASRNQSLVQELDNKQREIKKNAYAQVSKGAIVCPSRWMLNKAIASGMFHTFDLKRTLPNAIDLEKFIPMPDREAKDQLGITTTQPIALYITDSGMSERKGIDLLIAALEQVNSPLTLLTLGRTPVPVNNPKVSVVSLGFVKEENRIIAAYNCAEVVLLPSQEDNLPNVMLEAFACGTPVISFANGGMAEHIGKGQNGMIVPEMSASALSQTIDRFLDAPERFSSVAIRAYAEQHFSEATQAKAYKEVYKDLITL